MAITTKYPYGQSATIGGVQYVLVQSLPTASASTMGPIYLVPRSGSAIKDMYVTAVSGSSYVWTPIGDTTLDIAGLIVDDLTTGGTDKALSAEQGKIIGEAIYGEEEHEHNTLGLADADIAPTYNGTEVSSITSANRLHLIYPIPAGASIEVSCSLNSGIAVSLYATRNAALVASTDYLEAYTNNAYAHSVEATSTQAGYLNISYKNASGGMMSQSDYTDFMADVDVSIEYDEMLRGDGIIPRLNRLEAGTGNEDGGQSLYVGTVEQGARGSKNISSSSTSVAMSNTVGVPFEKCKVKAFLPDGITATFMTGTSSETLSTGGSVTGGLSYQFPDNVTYYCINFTHTNGSALTASEVQSLIESGGISFAVTNGDQTSALGRNAYNETFARASMRKGVLSGYGSYLTIAHISDLHSDVERTRNFFKLCEHLGVNYAVHTGDVVGWPHNGFGFFAEMAALFNGKTINVVGNHDAFDISQATIFNNVIKPFTDALGISTDKNYYYYDDTTYNVRFIVMDVFENAYSNGHNQADITGTQMNWLITTLASVPANYGVILCYHIPADNIVSNNIGFYQDNVTVFNVMTSYGTGVKDAPIQKIVNAFIRKESISGTYKSKGTTYSYSADFTSVPSSAEFICHLTGHEHSDRVGYYTGYDGTVTGQNKQLVFNICTGNALYGTAYPWLAHLSDCPRGGIGSVQDAFNVMTFFRTTKKIQVTRIGSFVTGDGAQRLTATFDYA